jgi:Ser-tRNA(Ala) deacylase AlaX
MGKFPHTVLHYLSDASLEGSAEVLAIIETDFGPAVILDQTIFYPQGGGQPCDTGYLLVHKQQIRVISVRFDAGMVYHFTEGNPELLSIGDTVKLDIDGERRALNSRIHTGGHLIDTAMINCGYAFRPIKGYHFPDSPYVEYQGIIELEDRERICMELEEEANKLIASGQSVECFIVDEYDQLKNHCSTVPAYVPKDKPIRVVKVGGVGCPCGGTHVEDLSELGQLSVPKIKSKGGNIRVSYRVGFSS